jgi:hypothetical protein
VPCPCHPPWFDLPNKVCWSLQIMKFQPHDSSSLLGPNILLNTQFSRAG